MSNGYPFDIWQGGETSPVDPLQRKKVRSDLMTVYAYLCEHLTSNRLAPKRTFIDIQFKKNASRNLYLVAALAGQVEA
ncbi:hypothetical protein AA0313_2325 [Acetobacter indonesiensis NRIC 0313]|uniref:Uncharacterized protein n=1 Tax=Acetobacter indonesiensis TaxID=104101 RepID=A0A6N3T9F4_9PROT|nr:hypothetical protein Abin_041_003 [Acetobacter indonesiensis]GBQ60168.1 hypothetical protein AA0313_2325 [Acetobacter indonesiensis NRIC 0313]GEN04920.1 hypothetical protein AIN02nite_29450 [Acetobacter indonesiensis]